MTILDALKLSSSRTSLPAASAHYMRQRAAAVAHDTMEQTAALHAVGGLAHLVGLFSGGGPQDGVA